MYVFIGAFDITDKLLFVAWLLYVALLFIISLPFAFAIIKCQKLFCFWLGCLWIIPYSLENGCYALR